MTLPRTAVSINSRGANSTRLLLRHRQAPIMEDTPSRAQSGACAGMAHDAKICRIFSRTVAKATQMILLNGNYYGFVLFSTFTALFERQDTLTPTSRAFKVKLLQTF